MTPRSGLRLGLALALAVLAARRRRCAPRTPDPSRDLCERRDRQRRPPRRRAGRGAARGGADRDRPAPRRPDARLALGDQPRGQGLLVQDPRGGAGLRASRASPTGRTSFDVGCVQINYRWHGHAFPSLEDMFDPEWTATYAAQFLRTLYEERGELVGGGRRLSLADPGARAEVPRPLRPAARRPRPAGADRRRGAGRRRRSRAARVTHAPGAARGAAPRHGRAHPRRRPAAAAGAGGIAGALLRPGRRRAARARARRSSPRASRCSPAPAGSLF